MYKGKFLILAAAVLFFFGAQKATAGELKVNGFADVIWSLGDDLGEDLAFDADGKPANATEQKFFVDGEFDFEYTDGPYVYRMDLDVSGAVIEQANFRWTIPGGDPVNLALTGGVFNAPIGFELQDAPDMWQTSHGQLFDLVPSNLGGVMLSAGIDAPIPVALDLYYVNEWRGLTDGTAGAGDTLGEENSFGGLLTVTPIPQASLAVGYITSPEVDPAFVTAGADASDENVLDVVLSGTVPIADAVELMLAGEYLTDENNDGYAVVANLAHNTPSFPHSLTVRYDSVECAMESTYCGSFATAALTEDKTVTSLTIAATVGMSDNLSALVEWRSVDTDKVLVDPKGEDSFDFLTLEFVATF